jgi:hypothetical protein
MLARMSYSAISETNRPYAMPPQTASRLPTYVLISPSWPSISVAVVVPRNLRRIGQSGLIHDHRMVGGFR